MTRLRIAELDFGMGNIRSLQKAIEYLGYTVTVTSDPSVAAASDLIVLPGDGAFPSAMRELEALGLADVIRNHVARGKRLLGVCIGFQLLFDASAEFTHTQGFGFLPGSITRFPDTAGKVPHMGWAAVHPVRKSALFSGIPDPAYFYFVHSFRLDGQHDSAVGTANYGGLFSAIVESGSVTGFQFHPEKSHAAGLQLLKNYLLDVSA